MLTDEVIQLYKRFRLLNYREMFGRIREKDGSLSATEAFAADVIYLLEKPTITQLAETLGISQPNATYKINSLIAKGYVEKIPSADDKREFRLRVSDRFHTYFANSVDFLDRIDIRLQETLTPEEYQKVADILAEFADDIPMESNQQKE